MSGLYGWSADAPSFVNNTGEVIARRMAGELPAQRPVKITAFECGYIGVSGSGSSSLIDTRSQVAAAISGRPGWRDRQLAECAATHSDAEALVLAYRRHGESLTQYLYGSYSLALVDQKTRQTILAVDRMGISPLCYATTLSGEIVFGTTATSVAAHPAVSNALSDDSIYRFLYFHVIPSPATIFETVQKLEPAQIVTIDRNSVQKRMHWQPEIELHEADQKHKSVFEALKTETFDAVARTRPDSSTACFLSGGLDSSTIAGVANKVTDFPFRAYTVGFDQEGFDETDYARTTARHFGLNHTEYYVTPTDVADAFEVLTTSYDEPFGNSSAIPTYFCAKRAKSDGISRLLAGDGGDELFGGNERYATQLMFEQYGRVPRFLRSYAIEPLIEHMRFNRPALIRKAWRYVDQARIPMPDRLQTYNFLEVFSPINVFDPEFLKRIDLGIPIREMREWYSRTSDHDFLTRMLLFDWKLTLADNDLRKVNRMCEVAGISVDYPLLDERLVDYSLSVPSRLKLRKFELRYAFKEAHRDFLPPKILSKGKHGFGLPIGDWLHTSGALMDTIQPRIDRFRQRGILQDQFIEDIQNRHAEEHAGYYGNMLWLIAVLESWLTAKSGN